MEKTVRVGDRDYSIGNLSTFKVLRAGALITGVMESVPELSDEISDFTRKYRAENTVKITRAAAELQFGEEELAALSPEAWVTSDTGPYIELPATPTPVEMASFMLPRAFAAAQEPVLELLALLVTPNSELREVALDSDALSQKLTDSKNRLLHEDAAQMVDLLVATADVVEEQFSGKIEGLRRIGQMFGMLRRPTAATEQPEPSTPSTPSTPHGDTDSDAPTDGDSTNGSGSPSQSPVASSSS